MGTETLSFWLLEPEKNAFKDGNPTFKIMTKWRIFWSKFIRCFDWGFHLNISLFYLFAIFAVLLDTCCLGYSFVQGDPSLKTSVKSQNTWWKFFQKILHFVMILKVGLPSLIAYFSGPKSQNEKVSVPISKRITCRFPNSPYFYS